MLLSMSNMDESMNEGPKDGVVAPSQAWPNDHSRALHQSKKSFHLSHLRFPNQFSSASFGYSRNAEKSSRRPSERLT